MGRFAPHRSRPLLPYAGPTGSLATVEINEIRWFHTMPLGDGILTPGRDPTPRRMRQLQLPDRLGGKSVLDIGAWDGAYSFECERRGAKRVLATDSYCWSGPGWGTKAGFEFARRTLNSNVQDMEIAPLEIGPERVGQFDIVLFLGVLYHMRHPLLALERAASVCDDLMIIDTETAHPFTTRPMVRYFLEGDNWCAPNMAWLRSALADLGFSRIRVVWQVRNPLVRALRSIRRHRLGAGPLWYQLGRGRVMLHASRR